MKPIAWYDPTNGAVSTDKDSPLFTPLGQVLPLYTKQEQEPVAWGTRERFYEAIDRAVENARQEMLIKTVTMRCKDYDLALPVIDTHRGHILVGQVHTPPQRTWIGLTKEERHEISMANKPYVADIMAAHEAKLKEMNNG